MQKVQLENKMNKWNSNNYTNVSDGWRVGGTIFAQSHQQSQAYNVRTLEKGVDSNFSLPACKQCCQIEYQRNLYGDTYVLCVCVCALSEIFWRCATFTVQHLEEIITEHTRVFSTFGNEHVSQACAWMYMCTIHTHTHTHSDVLHNFELVVRLNLTQNGFGLT